MDSDKVAERINKLRIAYEEMHADAIRTGNVEDTLRAAIIEFALIQLRRAAPRFIMAEVLNREDEKAIAVLELCERLLAFLEEDALRAFAS